MRVLVSAEAQSYRRVVMGECLIQNAAGKRLTGSLSVKMYVYPPDARARDIGNLEKVLMDSLEKAGVFLNDSQIDELFIKRMRKFKGGRVELVIETMEENAEGQKEMFT